MPSILAAHALTTLAAVNAELTLTGDGGAIDNMIERFINEASELITGYCGRQFIRSDNIAEKVAGKGTNRLRLSRWPIIAVDSIAIAESTVDATTYFIEGPALDSGGNLEQRRAVYRATPWPNTAQAAAGVTQPQVPGTEDASQIVVTYDAGYVTPAQAALGLFSAAARTLPWTVEGACIKLASMRWRGRGTDPSLEQESGQNQSRSFSPAQMPPAVARMLVDFKQISHA